MKAKLSDPVPVRFDESDEELLSKLAAQSGLKRSEIIRRSCRYTFPRFLTGELRIVEVESDKQEQAAA